MAHLAANKNNNALRKTQMTQKKCAAMQMHDLKTRCDIRQTVQLFST
jgi:hypothetical protein